jgi:hypothetical protein
MTNRFGVRISASLLWYGEALTNKKTTIEKRLAQAAVSLQKSLAAQSCAKPTRLGPCVLVDGMVGRSN